MDETESTLNKKKDELAAISAPEELESRLRSALSRKKRRLSSRLIAIALVAVFMFAYSFDALAYYGKQFTGYDNMIEGSLKKLNEEGRGQSIDKKCTFSNGVEFTFDGIMFDDNELVVFYKLQSSRDKLDSGMLLPSFRLKGIKPMGYFQQSGHGMFADDRYSGVFIQTFEPPNFYEKWMKLNISFNINGVIEEKSISFTLDRDKAMKRTIEKDLNKKAKIDDVQIVFDSISASAMTTVIDGQIKFLSKEAEESFVMADKMELMGGPRLAFDIVTDSGLTTSLSGGSQSASMEKVSFSNRGEALPEEFDTLQIRNIRLERMKMLDKQVDITGGTDNLIVGDDMVIRKVFQDGAETCIVISSRGIPAMGLFIAGKQVEEVNPGAYDKEPEAEQPVERTFRYKGKADSMQLAVKYIRYSRYSSDVVDIPVE